MKSKMKLLLILSLLQYGVILAQLPYQVYSPKYNIMAGTYSHDISLQIHTESSNVRIFYKTDGSLPDTTGNLYTTPLSISDDKTIFKINAVTIDSVNQSSAVSSSYYKIDYSYNTSSILTNLSINDYQNYLVGHWIGYNANPWQGSCNIDLIVQDDGHLLTHTLSGYKYPYGDEVWNTAFYYGTDNDYDKKISILNVNSSGIANGNISTNDELRSIKFYNNGNVLKMEHWHFGTYGPLLYTLTRIDTLGITVIPHDNYAQTISQLGAWHNNANFAIKYYQSKVITSTTSGIKFIDVLNPSNPQPSASIDNPGSFSTAIEVDGNYAFFGGGMTSYFMIADISNINFPYQVGITHKISGTAIQIAINGNYAYMLGSDTLYSIDIANKANPIVISRLYLDSSPRGITTQGNYAYIGTNSGLKVYDISTPSNPTILNSFGSGYGNIAPDFTNQRLFVSKSSGFDVISIANPSFPVRLFQGSGGGSDGVISYWNNYVFQKGYSNVSAFSINLSSANYIGSFNSTFNGQVNGVTSKDSVFYVSTINDLHVLKLGVDITGLNDAVDLEFKAYPNPVLNLLTVEIPLSSNVKIQIINAQGRILKTINAHENIVKIDLSQEKRGIYFLSLQKDNFREYKTFIKE